MIQLLLTAPASGGGKTMMTCALLGALQRRGLDPCAFKCGPDYIDPMFHRAALGVEGCSLDLFLSDRARLRALYGERCRQHNAAVCEGAMGFYDGLGGTTVRASAWDVAEALGLPAILVLRPNGAGLTLAALVKGLDRFRQPSHLAGILLNDCDPAFSRSFGPMLERETGLPVLGCLPRLPQAAVESRHLGLRTAGEIDLLDRRLEALAQALEANADLDRLLALCDRPLPPPPALTGKKPPAARIAVARDEAFCFLYAEALAALEQAGAELTFFSPLRDAALPPGTGGLYLPGGYPELYARALSQNGAMREAVRTAVESGLPTVAECGGFLYLCQSLEGGDGVVYPMAGALPGTGVRRDRLVRFGYAELTAEEDSLLLRAGETVPVHEFHYWDSTENGTAFSLKKPVSGKSWRGGFASATLYAAFPHLYFPGRPELARRFAEAVSGGGACSH